LVYNETLEKLKLLDESGQGISPKKGYQQDNRREAAIVEDEVGLGVDNETVFEKSIALIKSRTSDTGSDSESDKELRDAFAKFDANGSGFIDRKELKRFMRKLGQALSQGELDSVLDAVDTDCDGVISFEEFKAMMIS
jgi:Ca2+-binding EF-hand superfamily protein